MHQPSTPSVQVHRRGSTKHKTAAATDADAASLACLPRHVLASILLCLPASDVRRSRRVCKEWRDAIADPVFISTHMVHGPRAPTHTVVFYPGRTSGGGKEPLNGGGFLFDEQWRLTARFAVDESVDMIGTCQGLLCFRDRLQGVIKVVEPFAGDSISLPLPWPRGAAAGTCSARAYCFGFDAAARRYKIVYVGFNAAANREQELQVFTVGADKDWRTVRFPRAVHGLSYDFPTCGGDGGMYWHSKTPDGAIKNVRFDLATENITSVDGRRPEGPILYPAARWFRQQCFTGIRWFGEWPHSVNAAAARLRDGRRLPGPHAQHRGHLLLQEEDGALRAQKIEGSGSGSFYVWFNVGSKQLVEIGSNDEHPAPAERNQFLPVHGRQWSKKEPPVAIGSMSKAEISIVGRVPREQSDISTFAYIPTVSPAPFAMYLGTHLKDLCKF